MITDVESGQAYLKGRGKAMAKGVLSPEFEDIVPHVPTEILEYDVADETQPVSWRNVAREELARRRDVWWR